MKIFLDTAHREEVEKAVQMGIIDGVTTNPSLIAKEKGDYEYFDEAVYFADIVDGPISVEVIANDAEGMLAEARKIANLHSDMVVKIPMTETALPVIRELSAEGIRVNVTLIFSANQALLAAKAGATYVSPFVGRTCDIGEDGIRLIKEIQTIFTQYQLETEIIAASIRSPRQVTEVALAGAHIVTIPFKILKQMIHHPQTDEGIARFEEDWKEWIIAKKN